MHAKAMAIDAKTDSDWDVVCKSMNRGKQEVALNASQCTKYVQRFSGGTKAAFLEELDSFGKVLSVKRELPSDLFKEIGTSAVLQEFPLFGMALVKATMGCDHKFVINGKARLFSGHDIAQISRRHGDIGKATIMMSNARSYLQELGLRRPTFELVLGTFDSRLAEHIGKKV